MQIDFTKNHFELFGLPRQFEIDPDLLARTFRALQSEVHPDRFAAAADTEQRIAMQWATRVNEAYRILKKPIARARYLLSLHGTDTAEETNTSMPTDFLMEQMEWREQVSRAHEQANGALLDSAITNLASAQNTMFAELRSQLNSAQWPLAALTVRKLRFLEKLGEEIDNTRESLEI